MNSDKIKITGKELRRHASVYRGLHGDGPMADLLQYSADTMEELERMFSLERSMVLHYEESIRKREEENQPNG